MWNNSIWNEGLIRSDDKIGMKKWVSTVYTSIHWYACISINTDLYIMYDISLETKCVLSNASSIIWIHSAVHEILANKAFAVTDGLIS